MTRRNHDAKNRQCPTVLTHSCAEFVYRGSHYACLHTLSADDGNSRWEGGSCSGYCTVRGHERGLCSGRRDRKSVGSGKRVSVRFGSGGRCIMKKKKY